MIDKNILRKRQLIENQRYLMLLRQVARERYEHEKNHPSWIADVRRHGFIYEIFDEETKITDNSSDIISSYIKSFKEQDELDKNTFKYAYPNTMRSVAKKCDVFSVGDVLIKEQDITLLIDLKENHVIEYFMVEDNCKIKSLVSKEYITDASQKFIYVAHATKE